MQCILVCFYKVCNLLNLERLNNVSFSIWHKILTHLWMEL